MMTEAKIAGREIHLVGSVPMASAREVMRAVGNALGERIRRISDGEVGRPWVMSVKPQFDANPALEPVPGSEHAYHRIVRLKVRAGIDRAAVSFANLGYAP